MRLAVSVAVPPVGMDAGETARVRTESTSRQVEYFAADDVMSYWTCRVATSQRPNACRFQPAAGLVRENVWTTASS